jgi:predicted kinase
MFWSKKNTKSSGIRQLVIITGCAGAGKTTIGKTLAQKLGYCYIDKDTVTREYTDFILERSGSSKCDRESRLYRSEILPIEYSVTFKLCREILDNGCNVVLTIPFISQIQDYSKWEEIKSVSRIRNIDVKFIWIEHNIETEKENLISRDADRDKYKLEHWDEYSKSVDGLYPADEYEAYIYTNDCNINLEIAVEEVIKWIRK